MGSMFAQLPTDWEQARPILESILQVNAGTTLRVAGTTNKRPSPPQSIGGTVDQQQVTLTWTMPDASSDITGWRVYKDNENNMIQSVKDPNTLSAIIKVAVTTAVGFWISSVNAAGRESIKVQAIATPKGINLALGVGKVALDTQVADGPVNFGRTPVSNYGPATPSGKVTGFQVLTNADFQNGTTQWNVYDNNASGSVGISLVADTAAPGGMGKKLKIVESAVGAGPTPGLGGFWYATALDTGGIGGDTYHVGDTYIIDLVANIPVGYTINFASNSLGSAPAASTWLSSQAGTGNWQHYIIKVIIGAAPAASNAFPFFYLTGTDGVTWYVGQMVMIDIDQPHRHGGRVTAVGADGTMFDHAVGISSAGIGNLIHAGNIRTYLTTNPYWGFYGSPGFDVHLFGRAFNSAGSAPYSRWNDTNASGRAFYETSGAAIVGVHSIVDDTAGSVRTQLNSSPQWGFYGSPAQAVHSFKSPYRVTDTSGAGGYSPGLYTEDTNTGGRSFLISSGGYVGAGPYTIADVTSGAARTQLNSTPQWGFYGSPGFDVHVFGQTTIGQHSGAPQWVSRDTAASGVDVNFSSGNSAAGVGNILHNGSVRTYLLANSIAQLGIFGSPGAGRPVEIQGANTYITNNGSNPQWVANDTGVGGDQSQFGSGFPAAGNMFLYNNGNLRYNCTNSGDTDLAGGTPNSGFLSAGGVNFSDKSGNLVLKNKNNAVGTTSGPSTTGTSYTVIPEMTITVTTKGNKVLILFSGGFDLNNTTGTAGFQIFKDGSALSQEVWVGDTGTNNALAVAVTYVDSPTAASHTFDVRWKLVAGGTSNTLFGIAVQRQIQVVELG